MFNSRKGPEEIRCVPQLSRHTDSIITSSTGRRRHADNTLTQENVKSSNMKRDDSDPREDPTCVGIAAWEDFKRTKYNTFQGNGPEMKQNQRLRPAVLFSVPVCVCVLGGGLQPAVSTTGTPH